MVARRGEEIACFVGLGLGGVHCLFVSFLVTLLGLPVLIT